MINKPFFEITLVLLASSTVFSLELKPILFQQRRVNRESLKLLNNLPTSSIQQCLPHRKNFLLPQTSVNPHQYQKEHTLAILHEMLQQIFNLFRANIPLDTWEQSHMEKFLIELHQQLEYLEMLMGLQAEQKSGTLDSENLRLQVKMYFRRIRDYLENQEYSSCAWTIVRVEINRCLFFVFRLTGTLSKQEMDP
ncbi:PREDICTED: interferon epsilon [Hipposideros armiger]|uniref:Interferon epsilon n=1 Tax=Hipposideros armiger TaxID=186990 RepID=A0A8B7QAF0_HIPAR|nr:PREDICTED: interferon epsilon [Hipposideros armiger]XP_019484976.1 PREDICTED: interferon epsilon [Hipposideros armiger]XP_019484977.1 PREDICTED: interferon epsilon [Hipposideros armiger]